MVLAERDKELMDRELRRELGRRPTMQWHTASQAEFQVPKPEAAHVGRWWCWRSGTRS